MDNIRSSKRVTLNTIPKPFWPIASILVAIIVITATFLFLVPQYIHAKENGEFVGKEAGDFVGKALGSYEGIKTGLNDGYTDGKNDGISAKDTEVQLANVINQKDILEVLCAKVQIDDFMKYGKEKYAAVYMLRGNAVFSVDLSETSYSVDENNRIVIMLPTPTADVRIDPSETKKVRDWQKSIFNGETEDGFDMYLNSIDEIGKKSPEKIENYDYLYQEAKNSAIKEIERIAENICGYKPSIGFKEGE